MLSEVFVPHSTKANCSECESCWLIHGKTSSHLPHSVCNRAGHHRKLRDQVLAAPKTGITQNLYL